MAHLKVILAVTVPPLGRQPNSLQVHRASRALSEKYSADRHLPACGGAAGSWTVTLSPPAARGVRVRVPSCAWEMLLTIARPRPTPAYSVRMRSVPRRNGSTSVETNCGVSFSPVFSTVSTTVLGCTLVVTHTLPCSGRLWTIAL